MKNDSVIEKIKKIFDEAFYNVRGKKQSKQVVIKFSKKFNPFNAKIILYKNRGLFEIRLSNKWKNIDKEILKGLFEELISKLFNKKYSSFNIELYRRFIKNIDVIPKDVEEESDKELVESFKRVNEKYFNNALDLCVVRFGKESLRQLGSYNFHTDTITISQVLKDAPKKLLDYVMYHEMLHKYLKFNIHNNRYHTKEFKQLESKFEEWPNIEKELNNFVRRYYQKYKSKNKKNNKINRINDKNRQNKIKKKEDKTKNKNRKLSDFFNLFRRKK